MSQPKPDAAGARYAVLVIDMQNGVLSDCTGVDTVVPKINAVVDKAREADIPVIWVQDSSYLQPGENEYEITPALNPQPEDRRIDKKYRDSFEGTELADELERLGVGNLMVCGAQTDFCVLSTCSGAFVRGYGVTLVSDGHLTADQTERGKPAPDTIVNFVNTYWRGMRAPGRCGTAIPANEVTFEAA